MWVWISTSSPFGCPFALLLSWTKALIFELICWPCFPPLVRFTLSSFILYSYMCLLLPIWLHCRLSGRYLPWSNCVCSLWSFCVYCCTLASACLWMFATVAHCDLQWQYRWSLQVWSSGPLGVCCRCSSRRREVARCYMCSFRGYAWGWNGVGWGQCWSF